MDREPYRTTPQPTTEMPPGIPYIIGNEAAERFSFYGMRTILVIYMTGFLRGSDGELAVMKDHEANAVYHLFEMGAYIFPILGGVLSDAFLGKYRTILYLSLVYCLGHVALAVDETRLGLLIGLGLIAVGAGGIKPCVSAHVGDQFGSQNQHLMPRVFNWFYLAINLGAFASSLATPIYLAEYGPSVAFGVPGVLMFAATWYFWRGRHRFVHVPPAGWESVTEALGPEGRRSLWNLVPLFTFVVVFWSLADQSGSSWVQQAKQLDRNWLGFEWQPAHLQSINPVLILVLVPLFSTVVYPRVNRWFTLTPLRKIGIGLFISAAAFCVSAIAEGLIAAGQKPHMLWQVFAYLLITIAEILIYPTGLEVAYSQSPPRMKSFVMALYLLTIAVGNLFTALVNIFMMDGDGQSRLPGASYYWFFVIVMLVNAVGYVIFSTFYRGRTYLQDEAAAPADT